MSVDKAQRLIKSPTNNSRQILIMCLLGDGYRNKRDAILQSKWERTL